MTEQLPTIADGRASLVMFARGDRVFPVDDLGGGVWSRRGTVLSVHPASHEEAQPVGGGVRVDAVPSAAPSTARATVLWDDGSAEVLAEDKLCLVYDQEAPVGIRVVTMEMSQPFDVVDHGGHVVLVLREGLLAAADVGALRARLGRVRAALAPGHGDAASAAEIRRRDLSLLNALIAELTGPPPDDVPHLDSARLDPAGPDAARRDAAARLDAARRDIARLDAARLDAARADAGGARGAGRTDMAGGRSEVAVGRADVAVGRPEAPAGVPGGAAGLPAGGRPPTARRPDVLVAGSGPGHPVAVGNQDVTVGSPGGDRPVAEVGRQADPARREAPRPDVFVGRVDPARSDVGRSGPGRSDLDRSDPDRSDLGRSEAARLEMARAETLRAEILRAEIQRAEAMRAEAARGEAARGDAVRADRVRPDVVVGTPGRRRPRFRRDAARWGLRRSSTAPDAHLGRRRCCRSCRPAAVRSWPG
ncbi:hypothetical protein [Parafrankia sp. Ea1.12]|uniref:hypothetical protein n=1 Tax=Parafrankia sp. Ea1.12 TaxID=573499 RepID=UPI001F431AC7|nr:hypothetical protein [Parafrankia sp. Ea1.12]